MRTHLSTIAAAVLLAISAASCSPSSSVDEFRALEYEGQQMLTDGMWSEAEEIFTTLIDSYSPDDHDALATAYFNRSITHFQRGHIDDALADETAAIELNPSDVNLLATLHLNRSREYAYLDETEDAIAAATAAIDLDPDDTKTLTRAYINRASQRSNLGRFDEALADFDAAIAASAIDSDRTHARVSRAELLVHLERFDEAIVDATTAIDALNTEESEQRDGVATTTSELLGRAYLARASATFVLATDLNEPLNDVPEKAQRIKADLTHAIDLMSDDDPWVLGRAYLLRGTAHYFTLDDVAARSDLERARELIPSDDPAYQSATEMLDEIIA